MIIGAVKLYKEAEKIEKEIMAEQRKEDVEDIEEDLSEETFFNETTIEKTTIEETNIDKTINDEMDL